MRNNWIYNLFLGCVGVVVGTLLGNLAKGVSFLEWLSFGLDLGMKAPLSLDLGVLSLTFGISINLTIAVIICVIVALIIGRAVAK